MSGALPPVGPKLGFVFPKNPPNNPPCFVFPGPDLDLNVLAGPPNCGLSP